MSARVSRLEAIGRALVVLDGVRFASQAARAAAPPPVVPPREPGEPPRCNQCDGTLVLSCPEGCEERERCESGCEEPVTHHDVDGVPLCEACWADLTADTVATDAEVNAALAVPPAQPSGGARVDCPFPDTCDAHRPGEGLLLERAMRLVERWYIAPKRLEGEGSIAEETDRLLTDYRARSTREGT